MTMLSDLNNLAGGGGDKLPTFKFKRVDDAAKGKVLRSNLVELTDRESGKQKKTLVVELELTACRGGIVEQHMVDGLEQTKVSDYQPGDRVAVWLNPGFGIGAIRDALSNAGAAALEDGATLKVKLVEKRDVGKQSPANVFEAEYEAPKGGVSVEEL
jgi:hypothetical protein